MNPIIIRLFVLILIFAAIFLLAEFVLRNMRASRGSSKAINKRLKMIETGMDREQIIMTLRKATSNSFSTLPGFLGKMAKKLEQTVYSSGIKVPPQQIIIYMLIAVATIFVIVVLGAGYSGYGFTVGTVQIGLAIAVGIGLGIPVLLLSRIATKRKKLMQEQFPIALDVFIRGLRSGHPIAAALELLTTEMDDPIGSEFGLIVDEVTYGADMRDALQEMADRWGIEDLQMFVVSLSVQNETGGNLAEILENLAVVIRARANMFMKVRALSSEGRMTAIILTVLPIFAFCSLFLVNPSFYLEYADDRAFIIGFTVLIMLYFTGVMIIRKLVDLKV